MMGKVNRSHHFEAITFAKGILLTSVRLELMFFKLMTGEQCSLRMAKKNCLSNNFRMTHFVLLT